ncbi:DUF2523 domain-containing protein [Pseudomonas aeruginosa]|uniref:DUF2523 family protein n=2 Tax=Pseudomonas aeruginosa TaxID=287 RepID=UPI00070AA09C|nr:DUF2523 family protein [Pseudomonas aeruginosa]EKX2194664.1 DUF2523 domain-containing protein [Pseudomonas aeruginosa]EMD2212334.1 DUF2523 domain-containing protein [Pseudomonas aeruginosa]MBX6648552.1 DUF2523 domain-containing protein [Pseudomonas aeruginosa]MBX6846871.1 DUF2523 domain-containing protein [Pseudomonas aeruginosa]MBX6858726.1 DUF2523 domain-containing protein [Pseudomonas aeruginosa]
MEWLSGFLDQIIAFFQWIWDFFAKGIYDFVRDGLVVATKASMYAALQTLILLIDVSYTAARELIDSLGVPQMIRSMYAALPGPIAAGLAFFGVPQALNIIMVAAATRFCMRFVPFIGR